MENVLRYINAEYVVKGRGEKDGGYDCWGLVYAYYNEILNIPVPSYDKEYVSSIDRKVVKLFIEESRKMWNKIKIEDAIVGDLIVFNIEGRPRHVGILFGRKMLHIMHGCHVAFEYYDTPIWKARIVGVYRHEKRM